MALFGFLAAMAMMKQEPTPALWLNLKGEILIAGQPAEAQLTAGASRNNSTKGVIYDFTGNHGGILLGDPQSLQMTGSMTVATWLYLRSYANNGAQSEVLFRGDDRNGFDPYCLAVENDGTINFVIENDQSQGVGVKAEIPLNRWTYVLASLNADNGEMSMWLNGEKMAFTHTSKRPFSQLIQQYTPGMGIGNVQNDHGPHNQPLNGMIADLRLYSTVVTPEDIPWSSPSSLK